MNRLSSNFRSSGAGRWLMLAGVVLAVLGTVVIIFGLDSPFDFRGTDGNVSRLGQLFGIVSSAVVLFGMPFAAGLVLLAVVAKRVALPNENNAGFAVRWVVWGIVIAVVVLVFAGYGADILFLFGAGQQQEILFDISRLLSRVSVTFGMPLAAGLVCLSIAFTHLTRIEKKENIGDHIEAQ